MQKSEDASAVHKWCVCRERSAAVRVQVLSWSDSLEFKIPFLVLIDGYQEKTSESKCRPCMCAGNAFAAKNMQPRKTTIKVLVEVLLAEV